MQVVLLLQVIQIVVWEPLQEFGELDFQGLSINASPVATITNQYNYSNTYDMRKTKHSSRKKMDIAEMSQCRKR